MWESQIIENKRRSTWECKRSCTNNFILVPSTSILIEEGDLFVRDLPHGRQESYEVINPTYIGENFGTEPHYQIDVRKVLKSNKNKADSSHTISVMGNNSPVTIDSKDNYINVTISSINDDNVFDELRECISKNVNSKNKEELLLSVDDLEKSKGTPGYIKAYQSFMGFAKDCVTIISPFIPVLSNYLQ